MAAQNVTATFTLQCAATENISSGVITPYPIPCGFVYPSTLGNLINGTGAANAVDCIYSKTLTLAGAATHVDLFAFTDPGGNSVSMLRCRAWALYVSTITAAYLVNVYTRTGTDPLTWLPVTTSGALWCPPSGIYVGMDPASTSTNGWVVSSSSFDFTVDPGANTVTCDLLILGNSAA